MYNWNLNIREKIGDLDFTRHGPYQDILRQANGNKETNRIKSKDIRHILKTNDQGEYIIHILETNMVWARIINTNSTNSKSVMEYPKRLLKHSSLQFSNTLSMLKFVQLRRAKTTVFQHFFFLVGVWWFRTESYGDLSNREQTLRWIRNNGVFYM